MASVLASPASTLPLKVDDLVKSFGTVKAVSGVSLELRAGECLGLLGPNRQVNRDFCRAAGQFTARNSGRDARFPRAIVH